MVTKVLCEEELPSIKHSHQGKAVQVNAMVDYNAAAGIGGHTRLFASDISARLSY